jgi:2-oxoglutarate dehydrogenase E2 component (dihydrolipoamide succinyltransferase)
LEIATDKVDSEVPSTATGIITEILFKVNDVVPVGKIIAKISTENTPVKTTPPAPIVVEINSTTIQETKTDHTAVITSNTGTNKFYSPLVLNIAASEGVSMAELEKINGTGNEGRVTKKDILDFVANRGSSAISSTVQVTQQDVVEHQNNEVAIAPNRTVTNYSGNVEIIEMDRMRKLIAKHMVDSKHTSPHVTSFTEADVTNLVMWREKVKKDFEKREGEKITFTPLFIEAIVKCIKKYPLINCSLDGDNIIIKKDINIGMAAALPSGNLIVPVIKNADQLNLVGITKQVNNLANNAHNNKLKPDDIQNGTFTLTNVGTFGSLMGTPIINQPQVAILAVGAIKKRPVVIETPQGDSIAIRHMMYLSMSYDHRIVDGALGATFLTAVAKELENFDSERSI